MRGGKMEIDEDGYISIVVTKQVLKNKKRNTILIGMCFVMAVSMIVLLFCLFGKLH